MLPGDHMLGGRHGNNEGNPKGRGTDSVRAGTAQLKAALQKEPAKHRKAFQAEEWEVWSLEAKGLPAEAYQRRGAVGAWALEPRHELQSVDKRTHLFSVCFPSNPPPYRKEYHLLNTFNSVGKNTQNQKEK